MIGFNDQHGHDVSNVTLKTARKAARSDLVTDANKIIFFCLTDPLFWGGRQRFIPAVPFFLAALFSTQTHKQRHWLRERKIQLISQSRRCRSRGTRPGGAETEISSILIGYARQ